MRRIFACLTVSALLCGCANTGPQAPSAAGAPAQCFFVSDVTGFRAPDARTVTIGTARGETIRLETFNDCSPAQSAQGLALQSPRGDRVCRGDPLDLRVSDSISARGCPVRAFRVLTAEEVAALAATDRP